MHECSEAGMQICMDVSYHRVHCAAVVAKASSELLRKAATNGCIDGVQGCEGDERKSYNMRFM